MTTQQQLQPASGRQVRVSAVVGFILAFLFWPAGLLVSRRALKHIRFWGGGGRGLAVAGVAISAVSGSVMVLLIAFSVIGVVRSEPVQTGAQSAACQLRVDNFNRAAEEFNSAGVTPLAGTASARLATLEGAGYIGAVPDIPGLALDVDGHFTGDC